MSKEYSYKRFLKVGLFSIKHIKELTLSYMIITSFKPQLISQKKPPPKEGSLAHVMKLYY